MIKYYLIPEEFANEWNGYSVGVNVFNSLRVSNSIMWAAAINSKNEFPQIDFSAFEIVEDVEFEEGNLVL